MPQTKSCRKTSRVLGRAAAFSLAVASLLPLPVQAERRLRADFYEETPFGSLAWIRNSTTRAAAESNLFVVDLTTTPCIALPAEGIHWFMINHSDRNLDGRPGYFAVRILYEYESDDHLPLNQVGIHLQRNGNWFDASGTEIADGFEKYPDQITLSGASFTSLHDPSGQDAARRLERFRKSVGDWHLKPTRDGESSWQDRYLYGPALRAYFKRSAFAISARLMRFTATARTWSTKPVVFWLDPRGAEGATILINAPRHPDTPSRRVYTVKFGGGCL